MPGVSRVRRDEAGGGIIIGPGAPSVVVNGKPASVVGDVITTHGPSPHIQPVITSGSQTVFAEGQPISLESTSTTTCQHPLSGSDNVKAE